MPMATDAPPRKRLSVHLYERVLLSPVKQYVLAKKADLHPSILNKAIHGWPVSIEDKRWKKLAKLVGVGEDQIFEN